MDLTQVTTRLFFTRPERDQRDTATSAGASVVFHLILILLLLAVNHTDMLTLAGDQGAGTGIGAGAAGGGGGGGREEQVSLLIPAPAPETPEEAPLTIQVAVDEIVPPEEPKPEVVVAQIDSVPVAPVNAAPAPPTGGSGGGEGTGQGPGSGTGLGPGSGGGTGGGEGGGIGSGIGPGTGRGRVIAPSPEVLLIPPSPPGSVKGKSVVLRLAVDSVGVVKDAEIIPSTGDRKYDSALKRVALGWRFRAARDTYNRPVSVLFDVTFTF